MYQPRNAPINHYQLITGNIKLKYLASIRNDLRAKRLDLGKFVMPLRDLFAGGKANRLAREEAAYAIRKKDSGGALHPRQRAARSNWLTYLSRTNQHQAAPKRFALRFGAGIPCTAQPADYCPFRPHGKLGTGETSANRDVTGRLAAFSDARRTCQFVEYCCRN